MLEVLYSFRTGGSEVVGLELAHQLAGAGVEIMCTAVDGMTGPLRERCERLGITVIDLGFPVSGILRRNGFNRSLAQDLRALRLDAIHLQHFLTLQKIGLAARLARVPRIVVTEHSDAPYRKILGQRLRLHLVWRLAHHITVIHPKMAEYLSLQFRVPASRISMIPNGIETAQWHRRDREQRRAELGLGPELTFMFVGRLQPIKNVPGLIRAFLSAQSSFPRPARLLIVGDGPEMAACRASLEGHPGARTVTFLGAQTDVRRYLAAADVLVLNSSSEGVPRALLEAMCMGLPAISTAVGGIPLLLEGRGWLTRIDDPESVRAALLEAAAQPEKAAQFGEQARTFVTSHYDYRDVIARYRDVLQLPDPGARCADLSGRHHIV
ncbi:MAG TPA: glycosyltransferase family 4 protein [Steroidobacteraceae bacterium]|nr:glycosyltransferase family 4 protein [Steroidobacteraceae bacterium]